MAATLRSREALANLSIEARQAAMIDWARGAAIGDPNFLTHGCIDPSLASRGIQAHCDRPLGQATRKIASLLRYSI
jgi:hypothetical protein